MRKFTYSDAKSHKFWNIERNGASFTVTYGRQGTAGTSQTKTFADEAAAIKEHDKLVAEKVKKGYVEEGASTPATAGSLSEALEQAILANLDDLAAHMAYADWLHDQGNPRGDLIQVQLALEDPSKSEKERKALQKQEQQLLEAHARQWLGSLAEPILDGKVNGLDFEDEPEATHTFQRGWLDSLKVSSYSCEYLRAIARAPEMRSVRVLHLESNTYEDEWEPGPDVPEDAEQPGCHPLAASNNLGNVRTFILGELEDDEYRNCHTDGEGAVGAIKKMPRLEELRLLAHRVDTAELFGLKTLNSLRILQVDHCHEYPLKRLGANPSLGNLTTLIIHPHAIEEDEAYIRLEGLRSIARSPHLKSLSHLQLRLADFGDAGIEEIISSGLIKRLKVLDLMHGRVTDAGARMLAACPDVKNLERLNLTGNCLTAEGIAELSQVVPGLAAQSQWTPTGDEFGDSEYLYHGDIE